MLRAAIFSALATSFFVADIDFAAAQCLPGYPCAQVSHGPIYQKWAAPAVPPNGFSQGYPGYQGYQGYSGYQGNQGPGYQVNPYAGPSVPPPPQGMPAVPQNLYSASYANCWVDASNYCPIQTSGPVPPGTACWCGQYSGIVQ